ncbi:hypothetical protein JCM10213v2_000823 [Rhodosporidiobolus nylandii]
MPASPCPRRHSRPLPFPSTDATAGQAPPSPTAAAATVDSELDSAYYRNAVQEVQSVLYGGRGRDADEIQRVVDGYYEQCASFENPLTLARGKEAVKELFALLAVVPGTMWSELGDITESVGYDGTRLLVFTHTLHMHLLPFLDSESAPYLPGYSASTPSRRRSYSLFSLPGTPFAQTPSGTHASLEPETPTADDAPPGIFSKTHPAGGSTRWPSTSLLGLLNPKAVASALTTLHIKLHTRLLFNEEGRIIAHEDLWGVKELVEGVFPIVGHLYAVNRQACAWAAGWASRTLLSRAEPARRRGGRSEKEPDLEAAYRTPEFKLRPLHIPAGGRANALDPPAPLTANGLGLVQDFAAPASPKAVPTTTMDDGESGGE